MKKLLFLAFIIAGVIGWKYYGDEIRSYFGADIAKFSQKVDSRILRINEVAKKLYPTNEAGRERWVDSQIAAMKLIDKAVLKVPETCANTMKAFSAEKYPDDYDQRLALIRRLEIQYLEAVECLKATGLTDSEKNKILTIAQEKFGADYAALAANFSKIGSVYSEIMSRQGQIPSADFIYLRDRAINEFASSADDARKNFDRDFLARHNFLTKTFPESFGNLRDGIEKMYPNDFTAQLAELNKRVDAAISNNGNDLRKSEQLLDAVNKYWISWVAPDKKEVFYVNFVDINGTPCAVLPSGMLRHLRSPNLNIFSKQVVPEAKRIMISQNGGYAIAYDVKLSGNSFMKAAATPLSNGDRVKIFAHSADGIGFEYNGKYENSAIIIDSLESDRFLKYTTGVAVVTTLDGKEYYGFLFPRLDNGMGMYKLKSDAYPQFKTLLSANMGSNSMKNAKSVLIKLFAGPIAENENKTVDFFKASSLSASIPFNPALYMSDLHNVERLERITFSLVVFMLDGKYEWVLGNPIFASVAERYRNVFYGKKIGIRKFYDEYYSYLYDIHIASKLDSDRILKELMKSQYYPNSKMIARQAELNASAMELLKIIYMDKVNLDKNVHSDLREYIKKESYMYKSDSPNQGTDGMGNVRFRLRSS